MKPHVSPRAALAAATMLAGLVAATGAFAYNGDPAYLEYDGGAQLLGPTDGAIGPLGSLGSTLGFAAPTFGPAPHGVGSAVVMSFEGLSQYDTRALAGGYSYIPPDTMGAVGTSQFVQTANGGFAIFSKATGGVQLAETDGQFWQQAGLPQNIDPAGIPLGNGDARVLFDGTSQRWVVESFGPSDANIQIAVSNDSNALDGFKGVQFTGYNPVGGGIADYPTLAIDGKALYIGTNDYNATTGNFEGTTLNVISRSDIFAAGGPSVSSLKQFFTSYPDGYNAGDRGFAIQGVNQVNGSDSGKIIAIGAENYGAVRYNVNNPGSAAATETGVTLLDPNNSYQPNSPGRQPSALNPRVIDTLDDRISSSAYEYNGNIYFLHTITANGSDHTEIQYQVVNATTNAILQTGYIGNGTSDAFDYYQGSIAVNAKGEVVIGYNRSGSEPGVGNVSFLAQAFGTNTTTGEMYKIGGELLIHVSPTDDYHNGSLDGQVASGRQRWGDYSQVTVDPNDPTQFWAIGEFGREPNDAQNGHPGGSGGTRWGTWIADIQVAVPEPSTWAMMLLGFGVIGGAMRRRRIVLS